MIVWGQQTFVTDDATDHFIVLIPEQPDGEYILNANLIQDDDNRRGTLGEWVLFRSGANFVVNFINRDTVAPTPNVQVTVCWSIFR